MKKLAGSLKLYLSQYRELEQFAQITTELPEDIKKQLIRGRVILEILKQENLKPLTFEKISLLLYAVNNGFFDNIEISKIKEIENRFLEYFELNYSDLLEDIRKKMDVDNETESKLKEAIIKFFENLKD
jgi:F-type H+-transporting ATPase subunit alpha